MADFDVRDIRNQANSNAARLEGASPDTINSILDEINGQLRGKDSAYVSQVTGSTNDKLKIDGALPAVLDSYGRANFDWLAHGNKRIGDKDFSRAQTDLHYSSRFMDEVLLQDMQQSAGDMRGTKHEHVFLAFGNHNGVDGKRLDAFASKKEFQNTTEDTLLTFGSQQGFGRLAQGSGFVTKEQLQHLIDSNVSTGAFNEQEMGLLNFMQHNFKKMSRDEVNPANPYEHCITPDSLDKFAAKQGVTWESASNNAELRRIDAQSTADINAAAPQSQPADAPTQAPSDADLQQRIANERQSAVNDARRDWETQLQSEQALEKNVRSQAEHTVQDKETLWGIAEATLRAHGQSASNSSIMNEVNHIRQLNGLQHNKYIYAGQQLHLYSSDEIDQQIQQAKSQPKDCQP